MVGTLARSTDVKGFWFSYQMINIFVDKPENCKQIPSNDLAKLLPDFEEVGEFRKEFETFFKSIDKNQDGIVSCYGIKDRSICHLFRNTYILCLYYRTSGKLVHDLQKI